MCLEITNPLKRFGIRTDYINRRKIQTGGVSFLRGWDMRKEKEEAKELTLGKEISSSSVLGRAKECLVEDL